jgi:hypothetical protein
VGYFFAYLDAMATIASTVAILIGYDSAFIGGTMALVPFKTDYDLLSQDKARVAFISANIVSIYQGGCIIGAVMAYPSAMYLGRVRSLAAFLILFLVGGESSRFSINVTWRY